MTSEHPDDIVRLAHAVNPLEANIWRQALEEEGIRCKVVGDYLDAGIGDIPGAQAEIWVHKDDVPRAEEILQEGAEQLKDNKEWRARTREHSDGRTTCRRSAAAALGKRTAT